MILNNCWLHPWLYHFSLDRYGSLWGEFVRCRSPPVTKWISGGLYWFYARYIYILHKTRRLDDDPISVETYSRSYKIKVDVFDVHLLCCRIVLYIYIYIYIYNILFLPTLQFFYLYMYIYICITHFIFTNFAILVPKLYIYIYMYIYIYIYRERERERERERS